MVYPYNYALACEISSKIPLEIALGIHYTYAASVVVYGVPDDQVMLLCC